MIYRWQSELFHPQSIDRHPASSGWVLMAGEVFTSGHKRRTPFKQSAGTEYNISIGGPRCFNVGSWCVRQGASVPAYLFRSLLLGLLKSPFICGSDESKPLRGLPPLAGILFSDMLITTVCWLSAVKCDDGPPIQQSAVVGLWCRCWRADSPRHTEAGATGVPANTRPNASIGWWRARRFSRARVSSTTAMVFLVFDGHLLSTNYHRQQPVWTTSGSSQTFHNAPPPNVRSTLNNCQAALKYHANNPTNNTTNTCLQFQSINLSCYNK